MWRTFNTKIEMIKVLMLRTQLRINYNAYDVGYETFTECHASTLCHHHRYLKEN